MQGAKKLNVMLVVGGDSAERDVSLESGISVREALREIGHRVFIADPARPQTAPTEDPAPFFGDSEVREAPPAPDTDPFEARRRFAGLLGRFDTLSCDVVFNALHGGAGEDGTFQAVLEYLGIPGTGSDSRASALAMNKDLSRRLVSADGVPVAKAVLIDPSEGADAERKILRSLAIPVVVKPNREGSSVGVSIVSREDQLSEALERAASFRGPLLVEEYIDGSEVTASILDGTDLPLLEIRPKSGFYDYRNKYQPGSCEYIVPAPLEGKLAKAVSKSAHAAYKALGCRDYARVDLRVSKSGRHCFLEVNTLPGLTASSLVPKAARAAGIEFAELVDRILRLSLSARHV
jgi:D-alanine-D-alanine ligase